MRVKKFRGLRVKTGAAPISVVSCRLEARRRPGSPTMFDLRAEVIAHARAGTGLDHIERTLIEPAAIEDDEKAGLWLLAWSSRGVGGSRCRSLL